MSDAPAGWEPIAHPLLAIASEVFDRRELGVEGFDGITSALLCLAQAIAEMRELTELPCSVVGALGAERVRAIGLTVDGPTHGDAAELARALVRRPAMAKRILWPRGNVSDELALRLRADGPTIVDTTRSIARATPPASTAVFFASPSAVCTWSEFSSSA